MATEKLNNRAQTTLNGGVNDSTTTVAVTSATGFPTTGNFRILVDSEIMLVTSVSGNNFTVTRAQEGTTGAVHADLATCSHVITAASLTLLTALSDTSANRPAAGVAGRLFFPSDGGPIWRDTGSKWQCWYHGLGPFEPPVSDFTTWVNQSSAAVRTDGNLLQLYWSGLEVGGENVNMRLKSMISTPWTYKFAASELKAPGSTTNFGPCIRDSSSGKIRAMPGFNVSGTHSSNFWKWNSPTSFNANEFSDQLNLAYTPLYMVRIRNDGTTLYVDQSNDWVNWTNERQITISGDFGTWDQIGFYINVFNMRTNITSGITVWHASLESGLP